MKLNKLLINVLLMIILLSGILGCTSEVSEKQTNELSGTLRLSGSTTVYPVAKKAAEVFMEKYPKVKIIVNQSSTGEGLVRFLKSEIGIADATRPPKAEEYLEAESKGIDLQMTVISNDAVVIVVHKDTQLEDISMEQLKKIFFTGEINDWSQITDGKKTGKINVYGTDPKISGTAELFIKKVSTSNYERVSGEIFIADYRLMHPTPIIVPTVASDPDGIAYTPLKWVDDSVRLVSINGVLSSEKTILDTSYKLSRKMLMITNGAPKGLARDFINFILSSAGQKIVEEEGFTPVVKAS